MLQDAPKSVPAPAMEGHGGVRPRRSLAGALQAEKQPPVIVQIWQVRPKLPLHELGEPPCHKPRLEAPMDGNRGGGLHQHVCYASLQS